jgi:epoxyqueuosine reductase
MELEDKICTQAARLGFSLCGFATLSPLPRTQFFSQWLKKGYAGEMAYLARDPERRLDPRLFFPEAKSVISLGYPYQPPRLPEIDWQRELRGRIAAYAAGEDYHEILKRKLLALVTSLNKSIPHLKARPYVDTGPILEREWAYRSGLGWFGKNTMLLSKKEGSWFFLAEILVNIELHGAGLPREHCGKCRRCLAECPTGALEDGYVLNAPICISYLTIEHRGFISRELRPLIGNWIFGCDICQEVCPWGQKFGRFREDLLEELFPSLPALMAMNEEEFRSRFRHSAIRRTKRRGLLRNVAIALGNSGNPAAVPPLLRALEDPEPLVRGHVAWALGRLGGLKAKRGLEIALGHECDPQVQEEICLALAGEDQPEEDSAQCSSVAKVKL